MLIFIWFENIWEIEENCLQNYDWQDTLLPDTFKSYVPLIFVIEITAFPSLSEKFIVVVLFLVWKFTIAL